MMPKTAADVRAFIQNRAVDRPKAEAPAVVIDGAKATLRMFDPIDSWGEWWGMSAKEFASTLDALPAHVNTIELLINSPGGDAFDGIAIVNVMRAHPARTVAVVQGIAASAASFIACAADETIMSPNSVLMIHNAWGVVVGNADDMLAYAELLEKVDTQQQAIYTAKSGKPAEEVRDMMRAETWLSAEEAAEMGFADSVIAAEPDPAPTARWSSARWSSADLEALAALLAEQGSPIPSAGEREEPPTQAAGEPSTVDPEQASRLLATLTLTKETPHE